MKKKKETHPHKIKMLKKSHFLYAEPLFPFPVAHKWLIPWLKLEKLSASCKVWFLEADFFFKSCKCQIIGRVESCFKPRHTFVRTCLEAKNWKKQGGEKWTFLKDHSALTHLGWVWIKKKVGTANSLEENVRGGKKGHLLKVVSDSFSISN